MQHLRLLMQLLVEIPAGKREVLDLSGDAGAVGRFTVEEDGSNMVLDLKGVVYNAALAAMPCTACVVSIGQKEAKVCPAALPSPCKSFTHADTTERRRGWWALDQVDSTAAGSTCAG